MEHGGKSARITTFIMARWCWLAIRERLPGLCLAARL